MMLTLHYTHLFAVWVFVSLTKRLMGNWTTCQYNSKSKISLLLLSQMKLTAVFVIWTVGSVHWMWRYSYFLAGAVFCRFHILSVWSSEAVTRTGSTGWKTRARIPSKWLRSVNLGFHVFLMASLLLPICGVEISSKLNIQHTYWSGVNFLLATKLWKMNRRMHHGGENKVEFFLWSCGAVCCILSFLLSLTAFDSLMLIICFNPHYSFCESLPAPLK